MAKCPIISYQISIFLAYQIHQIQISHPNLPQVPIKSKQFQPPKKSPPRDASTGPPLGFREMLQTRGTFGQQRQQHRGPGRAAGVPGFHDPVQTTRDFTPSKKMVCSHILVALQIRPPRNFLVGTDL